jgi:glycosyltransferase involved in cell wall biosynthesis
VHLPGFFSDEERSERDRLYQGHCRAATFVVMMTQWAKEDLCERMNLPASKVAVVPLPPFVRLLPDIDASTLERFGSAHHLPTEFALFPAQTWPHKNHLMLLEALALLRDETGVAVPLVCCGTITRSSTEIEQAVERLGLQDQVRFLGWVDNQTLHYLYRSARCLLFPSRFEGWGMPITEAFEMELPVACSDAPWLPELVRDAAVLFDPMQPASIAHAIGVVWANEEVRANLIAEGVRRAGALSWTDIASTFASLYRAAASAPLSPKDRELLSAAGLGA